jgi:hypothetical protein
MGVAVDVAVGWGVAVAVDGGSGGDVAIAVTVGGGVGSGGGVVVEAPTATVLGVAWGAFQASQAPVTKRTARMTVIRL